MKKVFKWLMWILVLGAMVAYGVYEKSKPLEVSMAAATPSHLAVTFEETGTVAVTGDRDVYAEASLTILEMKVDEKDVVKAGDMIAVLDVSALERQVETLQAQLDSVDSTRSASERELTDAVARQKDALREAKRQLSVANAEQTRVKGLYDAGSATQAEMDAADRAVDAAKSAVATIEAEIARLGRQLDALGNDADKTFENQRKALDSQIAALKDQIAKGVVTAPVSGVVSERHAEPGQLATPAAPLVTLRNPDNRHIEVYVLAEDAGELKTGMTVDMVQNGRVSDRTLQGEIDAIADSAVERTSSLGLVEKRVRVDIGSPELSSLVDGSDVDVTFTLLEKDNVIAVQKSAVFKQDGKDAVWVSKDGKAVLQPVETGIETDLDVEIVSGLSSGDLVVRDPNVEGLTAGKAIVAKP